jgi:thioredoxin-like negative regulator of GroEL
MRYILLFLVTSLYTQVEVPDKYWLDDSNFEKNISDASAFGDDNNDTIVVEFWAEFNSINCLEEWQDIKNAKYYRVDIEKAPKAKKEYRVRMVPTILIFKEGSVEKSFKAGLDLSLPTDIVELQETIDEINTASAF